MRLLVATTNPNKVREITPLLEGLPIDLVTLRDIPPLPEPDESAPTFWQNAREKALSYAQASGLLTVAEDSGLEIAALNGAPGVQSARFLGADASYPQRFQEIYARLSRDAPPYDARFVTALAVAQDCTLLFETEADIDGQIAREPAGDGGFGYDPIFFYPPMQKTTAQMTPFEKSALSHRARAFRNFARWLRHYHELR